MKKRIELKLLPEDSENEAKLLDLVIKKLKIKPKKIKDIIKVKRSIDARGSEPKIVYLLDIYINENYISKNNLNDLQIVSEISKKVIIVGAGPAGYFAALELIELGIKPIIFERGKDVVSRRKDLRNIQQFGIVNEHSNYCFGEGGAGTYSDGKLYTRSKKRGSVKKVLDLLVRYGAKDKILYEARPHIGSNKLPNIVKEIRNAILNHGGEIHFDSFVTDLIIKNDEIIGVTVNNDKEHYADSVILSTGHSARDIYYLLKQKNIFIEAKPFAMGVRIEHPQSLIDEIQYKQNPRSDHLPASYYSLVTQAEGKGVFSFCMCPGGFIVPSSTAPKEIVINGMSLSKRNSYYSNSGIVVNVEPEELTNYKKYEELACLEFQKEYEQKLFNLNNDGSQKAPAQKLMDFVNSKDSNSLSSTSYIPGIYEAPLHNLLPEIIVKPLQEGFRNFGSKMKGYLSEEANILALESRTSSPVKITRDKESYMHVQIKNLYPCGEGAGYAGGIVSAAIDGQNVANAISKNFK